MECLKWAVIAAMKWEEIGRDHQRISKLKRYENDFDWDGIGFPVSFRDIKRFESRNEITINILAALVQAIEHELVLERIHRVIEFKQSAWMKEYIDFNTRLRTEAANDFEEDFYKLMNNSVFGKTMENIRRHRNIKLVNNREDSLKSVMKPNFKSGTLLGPNLMSCEMGKGCNE